MRRHQQLPKKRQQRYNVNEYIRARDVRVIDDSGEQLGIMNTEEAVRRARAEGLDLIEIVPNAEPPVCRIADFGAWKFRQEKIERKQKARQRKSDVKGIRLSFTIGEHDLGIRRGQALKFLEKGDKVKPEIILRGRQIVHKDKARELLDRFVAGLGEDAIVEQPISQQGKKLFLILTKKK